MIKENKSKTQHRDPKAILIMSQCVDVNAFQYSRFYGVLCKVCFWWQTSQSLTWDQSTRISRQFETNNSVECFTSNACKTYWFIIKIKISDIIFLWFWFLLATKYACPNFIWPKNLLDTLVLLNFHFFLSH